MVGGLLRSSPREGRVIETCLGSQQPAYHRSLLPSLSSNSPAAIRALVGAGVILAQLPKSCLPFVGKRKGRLPGPIPSAHPLHLIPTSNLVQLVLPANRLSSLLGSLVDLAVVLLVVGLNELALADGQVVEVSLEGTASLLVAHFSLLLVCS